MSPAEGPELEDALAMARAGLSDLRGGLDRLGATVQVERRGRVIRAGDGVAVAVGLEHVLLGELLDVGGVPARVEALADHEVRMVVLGPTAAVEAGAPVRRTGRALEVPAGSRLLGRVVDPLGQPLDGLGPLPDGRRVEVDGPPVALGLREPVTRPLRTGQLVLDALIPVGRGQRQLVVGDRATGKTELCLEVLAAQGRDVVCVYVAIGRRGAEVAVVVEQLRRAGTMAHGFVVVADADGPPGLVHLAPLSAMAMVEDLMRSGQDVLVVLDDLTAHADVHRCLALLLGRPVGREAFPVDVFYAHARLLERAAQLGRAAGGGSLTALPIVETQGGDLAAYIPTNIVSITDGQVRTDAGLAAAGQVPAVDTTLSVSRVGGKAQPRFLARRAGILRRIYAEFLELEQFTRFGSRLEPSAAAVIERGRRVRALLRQGAGQRLSWPELMVRVLLLEQEDVLRVPLEQLAASVSEGEAELRRQLPRLWHRLEQGAAAEEDEVEAAAEVVAQVLLRSGGEGP